MIDSKLFHPGTPVSSTNKTDRHNIADILLKVALNTLILIKYVWHNEIAQMALNNNHSLRYELIQLYFCLYWHIFIQLITFLLWFLLVIYFLYSRTQLNFMFMQQYFRFIGNIYLSVRWSLPTWWSSKKSCNQFCVSLRNVKMLI
jgi:hypothetical protein